MNGVRGAKIALAAVACAVTSGLIASVVTATMGLAIGSWVYDLKPPGGEFALLAFLLMAVPAFSVAAVIGLSLGIARVQSLRPTRWWLVALFLLAVQFLICLSRNPSIIGEAAFVLMGVMLPGVTAVLVYALLFDEWCRSL